MSNQYTRIDSLKFKGIKVLLNYAISQYKKQRFGSTERNEWHLTKERLAQIQKQQFYSKEDKVFLNKIRTNYYEQKYKP